MNMLRPGKVSSAELFGNFLKMLSNQRNLPLIVFVLRDNLLHAAVFGFAEDMQRAFQIERHNVSAFSGNLVETCVRGGFERDSGAAIWY